LLPPPPKKNCRAPFLGASAWSQAYESGRIQGSDPFVMRWNKKFLAVSSPIRMMLIMILLLVMTQRGALCLNPKAYTLRVIG